VRVRLSQRVRGLTGVIGEHEHCRGPGLREPRFGCTRRVLPRFAKPATQGAGETQPPRAPERGDVLAPRHRRRQHRGGSLHQEAGEQHLDAGQVWTASEHVQRDLAAGVRPLRASCWVIGPHE
jgi:hypothetical protein